MSLDVGGPDGPVPGGATLPAILHGRAYWLEPDRLMIGAHPGDRSNAKLSGMRIDGFCQAKIDHVVSLVEPDVEWRNGFQLGEYAEELRQRGVGYSCRPYADLSTPTVELMTAILDGIDEHLEAGQRVAVHCSAGLGRAGTVAACWLIRHEVAVPENAVAVLGQRRSDWAADPSAASPQTPRQVDFVEAWRPGQ